MDQIVSYIKDFVDSLRSSNRIPRDVEMAFRERLGLNSSSPGFLPGFVQSYAGSSAPTGWLMCDGSAVSRSQYAVLFAAIGTSFGTGDGSTTFNVPDARGRVIAGYKSGDANFGTFGGTLGEATHTLTLSEIPSHDHGVTNGTIIRAAGTTTGFGSSNSNSNVAWQAQGGGQSHNNIQPTIVMSYIIKT